MSTREPERWASTAGLQSHDLIPFPSPEAPVPHIERHVLVEAISISQLLATDALGADEWERAALVLAECRAERKRLDERLHHIDERLALICECDL